jgi:hypothetical protein
MTEATTSTERRRAGAAYAASVSALLTPAAGSRALEVAPSEDAAAATDLLAASGQVRALSSEGLAGQDPLEIAASEVQLLAGAALDLIVAAQLAGAEDGNVRALAVEEGAPPPVDLEELRAIIAAPEAYLTGAASARGLEIAPPGQVRALGGAGTDLADAVHAALAAIRTEVVTSGSHVVEGVLLLDAALLGQAISLVGLDVGKELHIDVAGLAAKVLQFVLQANDKIISLAGVNALTEGQKLLQQWIEQLRGGTLFPSLSERILGTPAIEAEVKGWLDAYQGADEPLAAANSQVKALASQYAAKTRIVEKLLKALALVKVAPPLLTPVGRIAIAVLYLGLLAFVVGSGYDYVDSDRIALLDRVEGVRGVAKKALTVA